MGDERIAEIEQTYFYSDGTGAYGAISRDIRYLLERIEESMRRDDLQTIIRRQYVEYGRLLLAARDSHNVVMATRYRARRAALWDLCKTLSGEAAQWHPVLRGREATMNAWDPMTFLGLPPDSPDGMSNCESEAGRGA